MSRPRVISLLLALITLLVYLPVCHYSFVNYDDGDYVTENHVVQNGLTWEGVEWAFTTGHASNWHPITWLSHMLDCELFGLNPGAHHLDSVLFHAANAVLLFALLFRLTNAPWPGAFVAALFAWHPLHVESVAWISERKDVLSAFFALLTLLAYVRTVTRDRCQTTGNGPDSIAPPITRHPAHFYWLALIFFTLGLMAKPMLVTLPFVLLLLDYWPLQRFSTLNPRISTFQSLVFEKWPFFLLTAGSCVITFLAQSQRGGDAVISLNKVSFSYRLCNAFMSYGRYLLKTIWPTDLAVFYPLKPGPAADVLNEHQPIDFLQVRLRSPPLHPASPSIQLVSYADHGCFTQPPDLTTFNISVHQSIPSLHILCPFMRPMLRDGPFRPQVHFAIRYDSQYDALEDGKTP
jgi:protein O-mannosyl-transferase